jgi:hypothetical protein
VILNTWKGTATHVIPRVPMSETDWPSHSSRNWRDRRSGVASTT